jgi:hypothetical protein
MLGIAFEQTSSVLSDNQALIINTQLPSSNLKKKHNAVAYHKCREAVAAKVIRTGHIRGLCNIADILTKPLGGIEYDRYLHHLLFAVLMRVITCMEAVLMRVITCMEAI